MSYHKDTSIILEYLYPNADFVDDWSVVHVDEDLRKIVNWNVALGEKPSVETINSVVSDGIKSHKFKKIREQRNRILTETDWMAGSDVTMTDAWKKYRQDLRDLPASNSDPENIVFPTKPK